MSAEHYDWLTAAAKHTHPLGRAGSRPDRTEADHQEGPGHFRERAGNPRRDRSRL
jgi:hypothetical protein